MIPDNSSSKSPVARINEVMIRHKLVSTLVIGVLLAGLAILAFDQQQPAFDSRKGASGVLLTQAELPQCKRSKYPDLSCFGEPKSLCNKDIEMARTAWKFFENNYHPETGLVNAADKFPSASMWDIGSALAATIAAEDIGLITEKEFDDRIIAMLKTLSTMELFNGEAPNKAYSTVTGMMVDYNNNPTPKGIGVSTLDLARLGSWLNILSCVHPKYKKMSEAVMLRWKYCRLIKNGQMYGLTLDRVGDQINPVQEGRLGYEQYSGKIYKMLGFDQHVSATYNNEFATKTQIYDLPIAYDTRDPRQLGAYNYVVTESYVLDALENGLDAENTPLFDNIYEVQKRRWQDTGIVTAVSEDNIDRPPHFIYNTIFVSGSPWLTITDTGQNMNQLKNVSVKAAMTLALFKPDDPYSDVLFDFVHNAYNPDRGWYSGIYEKGLGYNTIITSNTNGIILSMMLYKKYGSLNKICSSCDLGIRFSTKTLNDSEYEGHCLPGQSCTPVCPIPAAKTP